MLTDDTVFKDAVELARKQYEQQNVSDLLQIETIEGLIDKGFVAQR
ncbi:MAG: hypothetical protein HC853_19350 [Anaerolineae bacterium]|nr:hypothetical protein [Anaerolineae bacterium]